jgi:Family of unknown function (DUF6281)
MEPARVCGEGESGGCASGLVYKEEMYLGMARTDRLPDPGAPAGDAVVPACNDSGPPYDDDSSIRVRHVRGVPAEVALYAQARTDTVFVNTGYVTEVPEHPLHRALHGDEDRPRRRGAAPRCRLDAEVAETTFGLWVRADARRVNVIVDARTRIDGFDREGLPYLEQGDVVRISGHGCRPAGRITAAFTISVARAARGLDGQVFV